MISSGHCSVHCNVSSGHCRIHCMVSSGHCRVRSGHCRIHCKTLQDPLQGQFRTLQGQIRTLQDPLQDTAGSTAGSVQDTAGSVQDTTGSVQDMYQDCRNTTLAVLRMTPVRIPENNNVALVLHISANFKANAPEHLTTSRETGCPPSVVAQGQQRSIWCT